MKQPDGLTLFPWSNGRCLVWDFTCWDILFKSYVSETSEEAGKAADKAENRKLDKYSELSVHYRQMFQTKVMKIKKGMKTMSKSSGYNSPRPDTSHENNKQQQTMSEQIRCHPSHPIQSHEIMTTYKHYL